MGKVSYLNDLSDAYRLEKSILRGKLYSSYKNKPHDRWIEVMNAYNRKVIRKNRRSAGKSNKLGGRLTARFMCEMPHGNKHVGDDLQAITEPSRLNQ